MAAGHCISWADTALSHPCCSLSQSVCWRKSSCCGQGRETRITPPDFTGILASFRLQSKNGKSPSPTAFFRERELVSEDGNHSAHL